MSEPTISSSGWQAQESAARQADLEKKARVVAEQRNQPVEPTPREAEARIDFSKAISMTRVQFMVDADSKDLTILIRDKTSDKVLRTIPADAIKDLPPGQLLNLYW